VRPKLAQVKPGPRVAAPLALALARAWRRPGRWLFTILGIALATAFSASVAAESTIVADQSARAALSSVPAAQRAIRVTWQGIVSPSVQREARALLSGLGLGAQTEVVLLNPVRLSGEVVRPAGIDPLGRWSARSAGQSGTSPAPGRCRPSDCPVLVASGSVPGHTLSAAGVNLRVAGAVQLNSAVPLGYLPESGGGPPPVVVTGDPNGLESLDGLGVYRTHSWLALERTAALHSWNLAPTERRLQRAQAALQSSASQFTLAAPFAGLDAARAQAAAAPRRLLLAGGGALAALALFVVLAAGALRRDQAEELARLRGAGARSGQCLVFVTAEASLMCGFGIALGALGGLGVGAALATASGLPVSGVLTHSLLTPLGAVAVIGGWICATALVAVLLLARDLRIVDLLAVVSAAALALALSRSPGGNDPLPVLLAPLCCLAAGVVVFRLATMLLRAGERAFRRGPVLGRMALVGLARTPTGPSLAIAFIAVSTGLGGFALAYRATLTRGASDEAAAQVPVDAIVSAGSDFTRPLDIASLAGWRARVSGSVEPVRRTDASFPSGAATATVPALGVPAGALASLHGWRGGDGSASPTDLARRLVPPGPVRTPGPELPVAASGLRLHVRSPRLGVEVSADLRDAAGNVREVGLGTAGARWQELTARLPPGRWELEAFTLTESAGLEATNGHQNAENVAAATQFTAPVTLGPVQAIGAGNRVLRGAVSSGLTPGGGLSSWRGAGAAGAAPGRGGALDVGFLTSGAPGVVRPPQPSDFRPVPVLTDPNTAQSAGAGGRLPLTVDGEPVQARVVGTVARFPTLEDTAGAGFVVADEATLASALDAQLPGQGRADELWISAPTLAPLRATLREGPFSRLQAAYRSAIEHRLRTAPVARGVLGTLIAAASLAALLAALGLLVSLLGQARDERAERDLVAVGVGPRGLRRELRARMLLAAVLGVAVGIGVAASLTRLAVATVRAAGAIADPQPPLVAVAPWAQLALWSVAALCALALVSWVATQTLLRGSRAAPARPSLLRWRRTG
jgi:hypothetical protein